MKFNYVFLIILCLIFFRFLTSTSKYKDGDFLKLTSTVYNETIIYGDKQYLKIFGLKVYLPKYPEINYADKVVVTGYVNGDRLDQPKLVEVLPSKNLIPLLREKLISFYKSSLPEPYASLVAGITIGSKNMPQGFWNSLKSTGTAHVVVASGTNVTLTISFLIGFLTTFINRKKAVYIVLYGILFYIVMSGFDAPIIRAGIMGSILLIGQEKGRVINSWRVLAYSAAIMLFIKPNWINDIGFLLSFTATISLMIFGNKVSTRLKIIPAIFREGLSTSIAAQIGVAPIIFVTFGSFNLLSPIINMLVLWVVPYIMVFGAISGFVGLFAPLIGRLILFVIYPLLWYFNQVILIFT